MHRLRTICLASLILAACGSDDRAPAPAADGGEPDASRAQCSDRPAAPYVGLAAASLADERLRFKTEVELEGPGTAAIFEAKDNGFLGFDWQADRASVLAFGGFWDIPLEASPIWVDTGRMMHALEPGDVDRDGDLDALIASTGLETSGDEAAPQMEFNSRVDVWERTSRGLARRSEIWKKVPGGLVAMPFTFSDIDGDERLDILSSVGTELLGYFGDGTFGFRREVLGDAHAPGTDWGALFLRIEDRDGDRASDVLAVLGGAGADVLFHTLVYLRDPAGGFLPHAPAAPFEQSPSPITAGDVTGDGLSDVVAQGFRDGQPMLRLTPSSGASTLAPTTSLEPSSTGVQLGDVDGDGVLDVLTNVEGQLVAQLARDGSFERRDLGVSFTPNLLAFAVRPGTGRRPASLWVLYSAACDPRCDEGCLERCFDRGCIDCLTDRDCEAGTCRFGSCVASATD